MHQSRVRLRARVEDGDAVERCAGADGIDDLAHGDADLVVGVGDEHDAGADGSDAAVRLDDRLGWLLSGQPVEAPIDLGIGVLVAGAADENGDVGGNACCLQESSRVRRELLRQVHDDGAELRGSAGGTQRVGGRGHQVLLVVPIAFELGARDSVQPHDVPGSRPGRGDGFETEFRDLAQLAIRRDERGLGGVVLCDGCEEPRVDGECGAQRNGDDRRRHRPAAGARECGRPEELGQAVGSDEADGCEPDAAGADRPERSGGKQPARGDTDVVRRHDDGHGRERIVPLDCAELRPQRLRPAPPVTHGLHP